MKNFIKLAVAVFTVVVFVACTQSKPKEGQVIGTLYSSDGTRYAEGASVFAVSDQSISSGKISADLPYKTNSEGEFKIENVEVGHYALWILVQPKFDRTPGINNVPVPQFGHVSSRGKPVYFTMSKGEGINLGNIEVTEIVH